LPRELAYLAVLLDAYSRRVVGWCLSRQIHAKVAITALERALAWRKPPEGWIHHSDRGVQ
jgi:putative transposase